MTANSDDIYIKADRNIEVAKKSVTLGDVLKIECVNPAMLARIRSTHLLTFHHPDNKRERRVVMSVLKVIQKIHEIYPDAAVENIGETDFIVEYKDTPKPAKWLEIVKAAFVSLIIFFGAGFTIMTFNTDVSVGDVFSLFYRLVMGTEQTKGSIMEITYCVGIAIGILGFYNHFSARNERDDPTPLHLEMRNYEQEMNNVIIKNASREGKEIS